MSEPEITSPLLDELRRAEAEIMPDALDPEQRARVAALRGARDALVKRGPWLVAGAADAMDLVNVAGWILTGNDPWADLNAARIENSEAGQ
jgi:hypothetical protein